MKHIIVHKDFINKHKAVLAALVVCCVWAISAHLYAMRVNSDMHKIMQKKDEAMLMQNLENALLAGKIVDHYRHNFRVIEFKTVLQAIIAIQRHLPQVFKTQIYDLKDCLALIMIESDFNPRAVSNKGAVGLWQTLHIKKYLIEVDGVKDPYDIACNTRMGLEILRDKYYFHKDKKKALIGYNGLVYNDKGELSEDYYYKWKQARDVLENF